MRCSYLPGFARRLLTAGEEAAELSRMNEIVARHYEREVTHLTKNVATIIEPILIVGLASVVLIIALAIFLPMWNMAVLIK
jgi:MSHA biogenesis protein MshG